MKKQAGFTLIELVMVIVILGILAAVALPKFVDLSTDAKKAAIAGIAGALSSAGTINYTQRSIGGTASGVKVTSADCAAFAASGIQGGTPVGYVVAGTAPNCTVDTTPTATSAVPAYVPLIN